MKVRWIFVLCLACVVFSLTACNPSTDPVQTSAPPSEETPSPSLATSLFTLLTTDNYGDEPAVSPSDPLEPGTLPAIESLPPIDPTLIGKEMTVNLGLEAKPIYFYYCKTEKTERLVMIIGDGALGEIAYPLLIVAEVDFGGWGALKYALTNQKDFGIKILAATNISLIEGSVYIPNSVQVGVSKSAQPNGLIEYYGKAGGGEEVVFLPRTAANAFHQLFDRFSLNDQIGVWIDPSES